MPGGKSEHYLVSAGSGEYALRRSRGSKTSSDIRIEHDLIAYLHEDGFPAPTIVPSASGDTCAAVNGYLYSVSLFVRGSGYRAGNAEHLREAARTLAPYHRIVASFHPTSQPPQEPFLNEVLRERLSGMPSSGTISGFATAHYLLALFRLGTSSSVRNWHLCHPPFLRYRSAVSITPGKHLEALTSCHSAARGSCSLIQMGYSSRLLRIHLPGTWVNSAWTLLGASPLHAV